MTARTLPGVRLAALFLLPVVLVTLPLPARAQAASKSWSTYIGGTGTEDISGIAQNFSTGSVVTVGSTTSLCSGTGVFTAKEALVSIFDSAGSPISPSSPCITFGGASTDDVANAVAVGPTGDIYVVGSTKSSSIPFFSPNVTGTYKSGDDAFLARFTSSGAPVWFMYLGSPGADVALGVTVLGTDVYVTGSTDSALFLGGTGPALAGTAGFVTRVNVMGTSPAVSWVKLFDGAGSDVLNGVTLSQLGGLLAVGTTSSSALAFPTVGSPKGGKDALVVKMTEAGDVTWITYLGTSSDDEGRAIFAGVNTEIIVAGTMPANIVAKQAFVTWLNSFGAELRTQSFGGTGDDEVMSAALDLDGNVYVGGSTSSGDFPRDLAFDPVIESGSGLREGFVAMLPAGGGKPAWSSYLGASGVDAVKALSIRSGKRLVVAGNTSSSDLVSAPSPYDSTLSTSPDGFIQALDVLDTSPPFPRTVNDRPQEDGTLTDIDEQSSTASISANWDAFRDTESGVLKYECALGTSPGATDVSGFVFNNPFTQTSCTIQAPLTLGTTYYVTVRGTNGVNLTVTSISDGVTVTEPPSTDGGTDGGSSESDGGSDGGPDELPSGDDAALLGWSCTAANGGLPMLIGLLALGLLARRRGASSR